MSSSYERTVIEEALWYNEAKLNRLRERFEAKSASVEARVQELRALLEEHDAQERTAQWNTPIGQTVSIPSPKVDAPTQATHLGRHFRAGTRVTVPGSTADHDRRAGTVTALLVRQHVIGVTVKLDDIPGTGYWFPLSDVRVLGE